MSDIYKRTERLERKRRMMKERLLVLEDGSVYKGKAFGSDHYHIGELVFNTSMTGYQEIQIGRAHV